MDILYIIGEGTSKCNYNELRYSLRSIEKYGKNIDRVFIAGYCPDWLSDEVIKVPCDQPYNSDDQVKKHANMLYTILYTIDHTDIGNEFLVSMDDHFYIRKTDFNNYPFYCKKYGTDNCLPIKGKSEYRQLLVETRKRCEEHELSKFYLTLHRNMHLDRKTISDCRAFLNQVVSQCIPLESIAYLLNYRYSRRHDFEIVPVDDIKLNGGVDWWKANPDYTEVFSTCDFEEGVGLDCLIKNLYGNKSKYENE